MAPGYYDLAVYKEGFHLTHRYFTVNDTAVIADVVLNPETEENPTGTDDDLMLVTLTWGSTPSDVDAHMFGPVGGGSNGRFHVYYSAKNWSDSEKTVDLDYDDTTSYGPEHITVSHIGKEGTYSFYLHDYTNRGATQSTALSYSGAKVEVYIGNNLIAIYNVPAGQPGTVWHVFDYDAKTKKIKGINSFHYSSSSSTLSVSSVDGEDLSLVDSFLLLPEKEEFFTETLPIGFLPEAFDSEEIFVLDNAASVEAGGFVSEEDSGFTTDFGLEAEEAPEWDATASTQDMDFGFWNPELLQDANAMAQASAE